MSDIKESEFWLEGAKKVSNSGESEKEKYTVAVAMTIHSIIKANDALTVKFMNKRAVRHDEAPELFRQLVQFNKIPAKFSDLRLSVLAPAIQIKSKADYKGFEASKSDTERWIRSADKFLNAVKECLNE
ncbi:MAG: hypothetical protein ABIF85_02180 [Nanoarchaeota archaeon]|nr:hypothetical protein [Nanoarchaeota archaeon]MBU4300850.1 hypothetical protein [Nanoarchaeota archaeon]MBU4451551.1 hypothetical protein [Nanoarchaeota archaeon]MCG2724482.1 hypothetical protein [archaeon]